MNVHTYTHMLMNAHTYTGVVYRKDTDEVLVVQDKFKVRATVHHIAYLV